MKRHTPFEIKISPQSSPTAQFRSHRDVSSTIENEKPKAPIESNSIFRPTQLSFGEFSLYFHFRCSQCGRNHSIIGTSPHFSNNRTEWNCLSRFGMLTVWLAVGVHSDPSKTARILPIHQCDRLPIAKDRSTTGSSLTKPASCLSFFCFCFFLSFKRQQISGIHCTFFAD